MTKTTGSLRASESVAAGHPDKIADQISDAIVDAVLAQDPQGRVAAETLVGHNKIVLAGEITAAVTIDLEKIARTEIRRLGYTEPSWGFSDTSSFVSLIHQQSPEIARGVDQDGAGDQGIVYGYATDETPEFLPLSVVLSHALVRRLDEVRESSELSWLRPDGKAQVVVRYERDQPVAIEHVTLAAAHQEDCTHEEVFSQLFQTVITPVLATRGFAIEPYRVIVNGTGLWHIPGPSSDAGLTGRKIVVDGYGGISRVGGGAFSGKDPSKVDRSGAYIARYIAKNIVASGQAKRAEVSLAFYIGGTKPVQFAVDTFGTEKVSHEEIYRFAKKLLPETVRGIIELLDLRRPIYHQTAVYGHFGKANLPWEALTAKR